MRERKFKHRAVICHWHAANTGLTFHSHTTQRMVNPAARQWLQSFFLQSPIYLFRIPELSVPRSGTGKGTTRSLVIMRNKNLQHREVEGRLLWLKTKGTRGWKSRRS